MVLDRNLLFLVRHKFPLRTMNLPAHLCLKYTAGRRTLSIIARSNDNGDLEGYFVFAKTALRPRVRLAGQAEI